MAGAKGYYVALIGRLIFGVGSEKMNIAVSVGVALLFDRQKLGLLMGLPGAFGWVGYLVGFIVEPWIEMKSGMKAAIAMTIYISLFTMLITFILLKFWKKSQS